MRLAKLIVAPSERFADHLARDYGIPADRFRVVPNPIDTQRFYPDRMAPAGAPPPTPLTLLFVSRMAVRKGVEMIVDLSHRLADLAGQVRICAIGDRSLWSNYLPLLGRLNPAIAEHVGQAGVDRLPELYRGASGLLQPSRYEPFALTVGEALASGTPVVASDEVGATEEVDPKCCLVFPSGDMDAFEGRVRELVANTLAGEGEKMRAVARREAERLYSPEVVATRLLDVLAEAAR